MTAAAFASHATDVLACMLFDGLLPATLRDADDLFDDVAAEDADAGLDLVAARAAYVPLARDAVARAIA